MPIVRARDLRRNIQELGFEKGVVTTLELLLDEYAADRQTLLQMVEAMQAVGQNMDRFLMIGEGMKSKLEQMRRDIDKGNDISDIIRKP